MKKRLHLTVVALLFFVFAFAQSVPQGMKYQAVARNLQGEVIANQEISLRISLVTNGKSNIYYSEVHKITTNELGLFTLVIGEGKKEKGEFKDVPWSTDEIWMEVSIKDKNSSSFATISNSKLLAVPYAFHAATASQLVGSKETILSSGTSSGIPSNNWSLKGNTESNPLTDKLGTGDLADLVIVTNNIERIRVLANGDVNLLNTLNIGKDLNVKNNVNLNTEGGVTDIKGATTLENTLAVTGATTLSNKLDVSGITSIKNNNQSTTPANGALVVTGGVGIGGDLNVAGATSFGSVKVSSSVTARSLNVTNDTTSFVATITNTNAGEGDGLKIKLGRVHPLWNGTAYERITADDYSPIYHAFQDQVDLVGGWVKNKKVDITGGDLWSLVKNTGMFLGGALCQLTNAISPTLNEKLGLPLDLATPINTQLSLPLNLATPINNQLSLPLDVSAKINSGIGLPYNFTSPINTGLGLPYKIGPYSTPSVHIWDKTTIFGGIDLGLLGSIPELAIPALDIPSKEVIPSTTVMPKLPDVTIPAIPSFVIPAIPSSALTIPAIPKQYLTIPAIPQIDCSSLPTIGMPNIKTSDVTNSLTNKNEFLRFADKDDRVVGMVRAQSIGDYATYLSSNEYLFSLVAAAGGIDIARGLLSLGKEFKKMNDNYNKLGVEYISGNGDYAEWMQRENFNEIITAGDIVGVKGGKITKDLKGAEQIMAVTTAPIVNANMPEKSKVGSGNSIAFMGQIPVKITGPVTTGDFIVAKGTIPGYGVAVKQEDMTTEDYRLVVGRAWETIAVDGPKMVNTLVGVQNNDFLKIIEKYQHKAFEAEQRLARTEDRLDAIEKKLNLKHTSKKNTNQKR